MSIEPWRRRGLERARRGDFAGAAGDFRRALAAEPDDQAAWQGLARAALALQDLQEAARAAQVLTVRFADSAASHVLAGHVDKARGDTAAALQCYRRALTCDRGAGEALFGLADLEPPAADSDLAGQARRVADDPSAPVPDRVNAAFALARIFDAAGHFAAAMEYLTAANELARADLARQGTVYDPAEVAAQIAATMAAYTAASFDRPLDPLPVDVTPIFVIGLPRSGTTLIEQILASHPRIAAGGELTAAMQCEEDFRRRRQAAGRTGLVKASDPTDRALLETARERYLEALFERNLDAPFVVDKLPANFRIAGFLRLLFAQAPIIHSRRNGAATGFSLYNANFAGHEPYYHDLDHLAHYYGQYQRLMQHWQQVVEPPLHTVHYEALAADPATQIPALLHAAGLDMHPDCMTFHRLDRPVFTASHAQVRQPVYTKAVDHWRHYAAWLGPVTQLDGH